MGLAMLRSMASRISIGKGRGRRGPRRPVAPPTIASGCDTKGVISPAESVQSAPTRSRVDFRLPVAESSESDLGLDDLYAELPPIRQTPPQYACPADAFPATPMTPVSLPKFWDSDVQLWFFMAEKTFLLKNVVAERSR